MRVFGVLALLFLASIAHAAPVVFDQAFAPAAPLLSEAEKPFRDAICLNGSWQFQPVAVPKTFKPDAGQPPELRAPRDDAWDATPIKIPSHWNVNTWGNGRNVGAGTPFPYRPDSVYFPSYPESWDGVRMAWMRRRVDVPAGWRDRRVLLRFDAVAGECRVLVNGKPVGQPHFDSYLPFELDVTDAIKPGTSNEILVGVRSPHLFDQRSERYPKMIAPYPCGSNTDGLAGIWQDVNLIAAPTVRIDDAFVQPRFAENRLSIDVTLRNDGDAPRMVDTSADVREWINDAPVDDVSRPLAAPEPKSHLGPPIAGIRFAVESVTIAPHATQHVTIEAQNVGGLKPWSPASPSLYVATVRLEEAGKTVDLKWTRFGWRAFTISGDQLLLNGQPFKAVGDLTHPFGAYVMTRRTAWDWFEMVRQMGGNAVRLHAQPMPNFYLDLADEMGIVVLDETAIFGSSIRLNFDSADAWRRFGEHVDGLVTRDRNHPSVFGWSVGNELFAIFELNNVKADDADRWYGQLDGLAKRAAALDPTRPWISVDGDEDLRGPLPTWSKHFGLGIPLDRLPAKPDKPLMVGESGGTYYARPAELAKINGDRAYESYAGRNEALALDLYENLTQMARPRLAYFSPSEMVWFGLEPLNLGYTDFSRLPTKSDGVTFAPFVEGQPGMQIERLPPYVTTLNPGWDASLPLFKPLAMFEAAKAALHEPQPLPDPFHRVAQPSTRPATRLASIDRVACYGDDTFRQRLRLLGVPLIESDRAHEAGGVPLVVLDAKEDLNIVRIAMDACTDAGGTALILVGDVSHNGMISFNAGQRLPVVRSAFSATALTRDVSSPITDGLTVPAMDFADDAETVRSIIHHGISGPVLEQGGRVLLRGRATDWSLFNDQPEQAKTAAVVLREHLQLGSSAALVELPYGKGRLLVTSIEMNLSSPAQYTFWRTLLDGMGVKLTAPPSRWLSPIAIASADGVDWRYSFDRPGNLAWTKSTFDDSSWPVGKGGIGERVPNARPRTAWRGNDVWMRRVVTLDDHDLADIASDGVKLVAHYDENVEIYINGIATLKRDGFTTRYQSFDLPADAIRSLHAGPNLIAAHCSQIAGGKYIDVGLATGIITDEQMMIDPKSHDLLLNGPKD